MAGAPAADAQGLPGRRQRGPSRKFDLFFILFPPCFDIYDQRRNLKLGRSGIAHLAKDVQLTGEISASFPHGRLRVTPGEWCKKSLAIVCSRPTVPKASLKRNVFPV